MEKICLFCVQLEYQESLAIPEYSEPAELLCKKNHKLIDIDRGGQYIFTLEDFRRMIKTAETCIDYEQVKP